VGCGEQVNRTAAPFAQRENISAFCEAARAMGVKDVNNFTTDDLFEARPRPTPPHHAIRDMSHQV
jgi:hypothetical protein